MFNLERHELAFQIRPIISACCACFSETPPLQAMITNNSRSPDLKLSIKKGQWKCIYLQSRRLRSKFFHFSKDKGISVQESKQKVTKDVSIYKMTGYILNVSIPIKDCFTHSLRKILHQVLGRSLRQHCPIQSASHW